ncbi:hypothetical protein [Streptomyces sp. NPDC051665]|uniref:hypothetical protein n=1 Tax=Streptomyces sp. NPDC051665 TaxID=3154647 RepID=UPI00343CE1EF
MESVEPPEDDVTPDEDDWRSDDEDEDEEDDDEVEDEVELSDVDEVVEEADGEGDDELVVPVLLAAVPASASDCIVPTRANTPAAASVIAAVAAAMRRFPLRTAVAAPRSLTVMTVPLRSDALSRSTVGDQPERSL